LVVGTYKLIGSSTPITQSQAQQLVILWKAYKELQTRDTKAQQEVTDLLSQINSSLTSDQLSAIDAMNLSVRDVASMMQELGVVTAQTNNRSSSSQSASSGNSNRLMVVDLPLVEVAVADNLVEVLQQRHLPV
jgi:hypothetical protein